MTELVEPVVWSGSRRLRITMVVIAVLMIAFPWVIAPRDPITATWDGAVFYVGWVLAIVVLVWRMAWHTRLILTTDELVVVNAFERRQHLSLRVRSMIPGFWGLRIVLLSGGEVRAEAVGNPWGWLVTGRDRGAHDVIAQIESRRRELAAHPDAREHSTTSRDQSGDRSRDEHTPLRRRLADVVSRMRFDGSD